MKEIKMFKQPTSSEARMLDVAVGPHYRHAEIGFNCLPDLTFGGVFGDFKGIDARLSQAHGAFGDYRPGENEREFHEVTLALAGVLVKR